SRPATIARVHLFYGSKAKISRGFENASENISHWHRGGRVRERWFSAAGLAEKHIAHAASQSDRRHDDAVFLGGASWSGEEAGSTGGNHRSDERGIQEAVWP